MRYIAIEYKYSDKPTGSELGHPLVELLESLQSQGSIGEAAKHLGRSYRHVWGELKFWEQQLDANLVVWGKSGKAAELTNEAKHYLKAMRNSQKVLAAQILQIKKQVSKNTKLIEKSRTVTSSGLAVSSSR
jgi:putative molybdopterin biosynthesis protein